MSNDIDNALDVLKLVKVLVGREKPITIDSGIFEHFDEDLDLSKDIYEIDGNKNRPIDIDDIYNVFKQMAKQFKYLEDNDLEGRTYFFEGIDYDEKNKQFKLQWGS